MFLKIPKEQLIQKDLDKRTFLLQMFLFRNKSVQEGRIGTSINELVCACGYSPNSHKGKMNEKIRELLKRLSDRKIISFEDDLDKVNATTLIRIYYLSGEESEIFESFVQFHDYEYDRIMNHKTALDKSTLATVFLFIKSHIYQNKGTQFTFLSFYKIRTALSISGNSAIQNAIKELINGKMLFTSNLKYCKKENMIINVPTCFALSKEDIAGAENYMRKKFGAEDNAE